LIRSGVRSKKQERHDDVREVWVVAWSVVVGVAVG